MCISANLDANLSQKKYTIVVGTVSDEMISVISQVQNLVLQTHSKSSCLANTYIRDSRCRNRTWLDSTLAVVCHESMLAH